MQQTLNPKIKNKIMAGKLPEVFVGAGIGMCTVSCGLLFAAVLLPSASLLERLILVIFASVGFYTGIKGFVVSIKDIKNPLIEMTGVISKIESNMLYRHRYYQVLFNKKITIDNGKIFIVSNNIAKKFVVGEKVHVWYTQNMDFLRYIQKKV